MDNLKEKEKQKEVVSEVPPQTTTETATETVNSPITEKSPPGVSSEESALEEMNESSVSEAAEKLPETETPTETNNVQEKLKKIVTRFYPDADVSTPENLMTALLPLVENTVSLHDDLYDVVEEFPEFGDFILGLRKGYTPQQAIAMYFDVESLTPPEGAEDEEPVRKAKEERRKKVETEKARLAKIPENQKLTSKNFTEVAKEFNLNEDDQKGVVDNFESIINDFAKDGIVSKDHWKMLVNGLKHETILSEKEKEKEAAVEDARIAGRNEQIEKKRASKETGDGIPKLASTGALPPQKEEDTFTTGLKKIANKKKVI